MLARVHSACLAGIDATTVRVEVDVSRGLPAFATVGLPDPAVRESRERVRAAIRNSGFTFPLDRITVNLAPADLRKEGVSFDLPIALGILIATGAVPCEGLGTLLVLGELALDGRIHPVRGVLPMAVAARRAGLTGCLVPPENAREAAVVEGLGVYPVASLAETAAFLLDERPIEPVTFDGDGLLSGTPVAEVDFAEVRGQAHARRAVEIAAAGGHHLLLVGPPGSGKSMLAERLPTILPPLGLTEAIEASTVWSVAGRLPPTGLVTGRPFRAPHHTVSGAGLIGGGRMPSPGEVSLAHHGVLFLDEMPEFQPSVLETLRQPLETGTVTISRAGGSVAFPAEFQLVGAMNACRRGCPTQAACSCPPDAPARYRARVSRPILDRIDLHAEVPPVPFSALAAAGATPEGSAEIRGRVVAARARQEARLGRGRTRTNGRMGPRQVRRHCALPPEGWKLLATAVDRLGLSARGHDRVLRVARTIADLAGAETIAVEHLAEALTYRELDRA